MATLLVLGSKPDPVLPAPDLYDDLACANASGRMAWELGLRTPAFTALSSLITSEKNPSNSIALHALRGLSTGTLYLYRRPPFRRRVHKRVLRAATLIRGHPAYVRYRLSQVGYRWDRFVDRPVHHYLEMISTLAAAGSDLMERMAAKVPSTGLIAVAIGLAEGRYQRVILSGFSFEITHGYASNPDIAIRGSAASKHADTDIAILQRLSERLGTLYTTELTVHQRAALPLVEGRSPVKARGRGR